MKKILRRLAALVLAAVLLEGTGVSAAAGPDEYEETRQVWTQAQASQDPLQVLEAADRNWELLSQDGLSGEDCLELEPQCALASWASEVRGDLKKAQLWLERQAICTQWLMENGQDRDSALEDLEARWAYLSAAQNVGVYALTEGERGDGANGAPASGTWYGASAGSSQTEGGAVLAEIPFLDGTSVKDWLDSYRDSSTQFGRAAEEEGVILLVWDLSPESTAGVDKVLASSSDSYIQEGLQAMGQLDATVLLQVGSGVNGWSSCDPGRYIQAFRKIAQSARRYDNIQMVFGCSDVNRRGATFEDYYPGDEHVDWVGVSVCRSGGAESYSFSDENWESDAYQGEGVYAGNPLTKMAPFVSFAREHNKPVATIFRSENGKSDGEETSGTQEAVDQLTRFYAYVNMLYPQVKLVLYDDGPQSIDDKRPLLDSPVLSRAYRSAIAANGTYLDQGETESDNWVALDEVAQAVNSIQLAAAPLFPGDEETSVTYYLDGKRVFTSSQAPYSYEVKADDLSPGGHLLWVTAESGRFTYNGAAEGRIYRLYAADTGVILGESSSFEIGTASEWAQGLLMNAYGRGLVTPRTSSGLQESITRLQFAELAVNLVEQTIGEEIEPAETFFQDTSDEAVLKAMAAGITSGKEEGIFAPDDLITRQEICVMLDRVIRYVDQVQGTTTLDDDSTQLDPDYVDGGQVDLWAVRSVALLTNNGIMAGREEGVLAPQDFTTVEEAIVLVLALRGRF